MFWNLFTTSGLIIGALLLYRFWPAILKKLQKFDAQNHARIEAERRDRSDSLAHFRHTLTIAEEQVEEIGEKTDFDARTGEPVKRYLFEGETYATRRDAQRVREGKVRALAREFYMELPAALAARRGNGKLGKD